jgi:hypothetical protein
VIAGRPVRWRWRRGQKTATPTGEDAAARELSVLRPEDFAARVPRHQFPLGVVAGSLALVLRKGLSLRRVSEVLSLTWSWWTEGGRVGTYSSVRLWLMRLGLHQLCRPKEVADDWMWIIDHTMQMGERKCLIIVGVRRSAWEGEHRPLSHEDVELIDLQPVTESTGEVVYRQLEAATVKTGVPQAIISDEGRDLHRGIDLFRQAHPQTAWMYDIKHKTACLLKHELEKDTSWQALIDEINHFKRRVALTPLACLLPPALRGKARYMSVDVLVEWAEKSLTLLAHPQVIAELGLDVKTVEEKLGWLRHFTEPVQRWREMLEVIETTEHYVRHEGIHGTMANQLALLLPTPSSERAQTLRQRLLEFLQAQASQVPEGERLLGSSEVLESIIGKFKSLAGERGHHGLTGMVLAIGATVGPIRVDSAQVALSTVQNRDLWNWCHAHLGSTLQSLRGRIAQTLSTEQKEQPLLLAGT